MRKRSNLLIIMLFTLSLSCLMAQNTGYMGKRVIVNMGAEFSPAWYRPVFEKCNFQKRYLSYNCILSPNIEVIAHNGGTAGIVYHYLNTRYNTPDVESGEYDESHFYKDIKIEPLTAHGFGIFYKQYVRFSDGRAPMGAYVKFQFDGFFFQCPSSYNNRNRLMSDQLFATKIEFGTDFLVFNRLRFSTGFALGVPFGGYKGLGYDNELIGDITDFSTKPINEYARSRIFGAYWVGFTVSVGFLAF